MIRLMKSKTGLDFILLLFLFVFVCFLQPLYGEDKRLPESSLDAGNVLLSSTIVDGVQCNVSAVVSKVKMYIGDEADYTIKATVPKGWSCDLGKAGPLLEQAGFEIRDFHTPKALGNSTDARSFTFSTFTTGTYIVPSVPVKVTADMNRGAGNNETNSSADSGVFSDFVLGTRPLTIVVVPVPPKPGEPDDIRDIKGPMSIAMPSLINYVIILVIFIALVIHFFRKVRSRGDGVEETIITPLGAYEIAIRQYEKLTTDYSSDHIDVKIFHYGLTEILKLYLSRRYFLPILSDTTSELVCELNENNFDKQLTKIVANILEESDLIKFARFIPTDEETSTHSQQLLKFLEDTKPEEEYNDGAEVILDDEEIVSDDEITDTKPVQVEVDNNSSVNQKGGV